MTVYRVECNFGSKYFECLFAAVAFYKKCKAKNRDVELWAIDYFRSKKTNRYQAVQELLAYSNTNLPKC